MDLKGLIAVYDQLLIPSIPAMVLDETEVAGHNALALTDQRLTQTGTDVNGSPFPDYTLEYKRSKTKKGRYRGFVDFQDTTQMLASTEAGLTNIVPSSATVSGATAMVIFGGRDELTRKKIEGNNNNRPGFLLPSKAEVKTVTLIAKERMEKRIQALFK